MGNGKNRGKNTGSYVKTMDVAVIVVIRTFSVQVMNDSSVVVLHVLRMRYVYVAVIRQTLAAKKPSLICPDKMNCLDPPTSASAAFILCGL